MKCPSLVTGDENADAGIEGVLNKQKRGLQETKGKNTYTKQKAKSTKQNDRETVLKCSAVVVRQRGMKLQMTAAFLLLCVWPGNVTHRGETCLPLPADSVLSHTRRAPVAASQPISTRADRASADKTPNCHPVDRGLRTSPSFLLNCQVESLRGTWAYRSLILHPGSTIVSLSSFFHLSYVFPFVYIYICLCFLPRDLCPVVS